MPSLIPLHAAERSSARLSTAEVNIRDMQGTSSSHTASELSCTTPLGENENHNTHTQMGIKTYLIVHFNPSNDASDTRLNLYGVSGK